MKKKRIVFLYPSLVVGGAELLFYRLSIYLVNQNIDVLYLDYENGHVSNKFINENLRVDIAYLNVDSKHTLKKEDILVCPFSYIIKFDNFVIPTNETNIFFWDLHPYNAIDNTIFSFFYKKYDIEYLNVLFKFIERVHIEKIKELILLSINKNSLFFMCKSNFVFNKDFFNLNIDVKYLPIPVGDNIFFNAKNRKNYSHEIHLCWMSRLDLDKINILNNFIYDCSELMEIEDYKFIINIIGDGDSKANIVKPDNLKLIFHGNLEDEDLTNFLVNKIDFGFAVGTSALEFGARGIPTAVMCGKELLVSGRVNKYLPLFLLENYELSIETQLNDPNLMTLSEVVLFFLENKDISTNMSIEYVRNNHSIDNVGKSFIENINVANLTYKDYQSWENSQNKIFLYILRKLKSFGKLLIT